MLLLLGSIGTEEKSSSLNCMEDREDGPALSSFYTSAKSAGGYCNTSPTTDGYLCTSGEDQLGDRASSEADLGELPGILTHHVLGSSEIDNICVILGNCMCK